MERRFFLLPILILLLLVPVSNSYADGDSLKIVNLNKEGRRLVGEGDFDGGVNAFLSILAIDSSSVTALNNLGTVYKRLGRYEDALEALLKAEDILIKQSGIDCPQLLHIYTNAGNIYNIKQDYELALQYFNYAERIIQVNSLTTNTATSIYNNIGNVYFYMKDWRRALNSYKKGIEVKKRLKSGRIDISYANTAGAYENMGILDSARMFYERSIQSKIDQFGSESYYLINVYNNYSILLQRLNENEEARHLLGRALAIAQDNYSAKHPIVSECHVYLGSYYLSTGDPYKALEHFQQSLITIVFDFDETDFYTNPALDREIISESVLLEGLRGKALALEGIYKEEGDSNALIASLEALEISNLLTEKMRATYLGQESKLFIAESSHEGLSRAINTSFELYKLTGHHTYLHKAFNYAEKSKSSVLLSSMQEIQNKKNLGIPANLQTQEEELRSERELYKKKIYEERQRAVPDSEKLGLWQGKLLDISQRLDSIGSYIRLTYPEFASKYDNEVISIDLVQQLLSADEVLIEYSFNDTSMFVLLISDEFEYFIRKPIDGTFMESMDVLGAFLRNNDFAGNTYDDYKSYTEAAYALYEVLLEPLEDMIGNRQLIIIPDGELGYIPFEALLTEPPEDGSMDYRSLPYLIYRFGTNYSYSATLHFGVNRMKKTADRQLLAFAPSYEHVKDINSEKFPTFRNYSDVLVPLRYISEEIHNIAGIMDADNYEGDRATEKTFREKAPDYDILHLAMHTLINDENPMYSQLVFTLNNDTLEDNDGLLNTYELFNIRLSARMAVLSACNTGYGQLRQGEGVMSLARGFISAGVPSIIMTLWAVEDKSGSVLMSRFYENLEEGSEINVALRQSKLAYLQSADQLGAHPYLWSGYVSIGSTDPLTNGNYSIIVKVAVPAMLLLLVCFIIFILRKRRKEA